MRKESILCSLVAGVCRPALSASEQERFVELLKKGFSDGEGADVEVLQSVSSVVVFRRRSSDGGESAGKSPVGGGCMLTLSDIKPHPESLPLGMVNGSWSIISLDGSNGMVSAARDGSGAEAFYYAVKNGVFCFTNSLKLFRKLSFAVDFVSAADFLHFLYIPAPRTIYEGVKSLRPGWCVTFDGERVADEPMTILRNATHVTTGFMGTADELLEQYVTVLLDALKRCCSGTRKVALFLSGGKDSSALAIAASLAGFHEVGCVTLGFNQNMIDESADAAMVARHLSLPHHCLKFDVREYRARFPEMICSMGQPLGDTAALPVFCAIQKLNPEYDIFLDGTGNDSYFGIPTTWQEDIAWHAHRRIRGLDRLPWGVLAGISSSYSVTTIARILAKRREEQFVSWSGWTGGELAKLTGHQPNWDDLPLYGLYAGMHSPMEHKTRTLCSIWEPEAAYRKTVQMAEDFGSLMRFPFLDNELVAWSKRLPSNLKMSGRTNKVLLRMLLEKHLPNEIVTKRKGSFVFPKEFILAAESFSFLERYLSKEVLLSHGIVDPVVAEPVVRLYREGDKSVEDRIWSLLLLHAWLEEGCKA